MINGAVFPPIVLMHPDVLIDGNHRLAASKGLHRTTIPAYVVQFPTVDLARDFAGAMQEQNGFRLTPAEKYRLADSMLQQGLPDRAIARELGISSATVWEHRRARDFAERVAQLPEDIQYLASSIATRSRVRLTQITRDAPFIEAIRLVSELNVPSTMVKTMMEAAEKARSDTGAIAAMTEITRELTGPPPRRQPPRNENLSICRAQLGWLVKHAAEPETLLDIGKPELRETAIKNWHTVRELSEKMLGLYEG
jgi:ParB-like chromosome segregation protein Spo0J